MTSPQVFVDHTELDLDGFVRYPDTPATSIGSEPRTPPKLSIGNGALQSPEGRQFLQRLDNFVPIGCLVSSIPSADLTSLPSSHWQEIFDLTSLHITSALALAVQRLLASSWIRLFMHNKYGSTQVVRLYVLPSDVGHRFVDRQSKKLAASLYAVIKELDTSPETWNGRYSHATRKRFDLWAARDEGSLYYMFNKIPSPAPSTLSVKSHFHRQTLEKLLDEQSEIPGLKARLYNYQRRSAGLMFQRESESRLELDPRLEHRIAPDGSEYYYGPRDTIFTRHRRLYESCKGGILAETMGLGKTVICVALMLSTKGHLPRIPAQYDTVQTRPKVGSLFEMAVSSVNRHTAPWKTYFDTIEAETGERMQNCIVTMRQNPPSYQIPVEPYRWNRNTKIPEPKRFTLASTTIVVVPRNLFSQWQSELEKHTEKDSLNILFMDDNKKALPAPSELILYDVILFSRTRFEQENRDGSDRKGRRQTRYPTTCNCPYIGASRKRDCTCLREEDIYDSPLKHIHFLRIIIDEGHFFSSANTTAAHVADKLVRSDHRWVVSGTPAKDLLGVEMDVISSNAASPPDQSIRDDILRQRSAFETKNDTSGAIKSIGSIASHFLKVRPWAPAEGERPAEWENYIYRHEDLRIRTYSGFSRCLRQTLESIVIKTRPEDVERDIELPPLLHNVVRLEPSLFDKLTANTFILVLTGNAVTSERTDTDYLFHKNSQKERYNLVNNLRQSAFFWTGFSKTDVTGAIENGERYLKKDGAVYSTEDELLLRKCMAEAGEMLKSPGWETLSLSHEVGLFVKYWPAESAQFWTFDNTQMPLLCGATQLLAAQSHVNGQAALIDPSEGLPGAGLRAFAEMREIQKANQKLEGSSDQPQLIMAKSGLPSSSIKEQTLLHKRAPLPSKNDRPKTPNQKPTTKGARSSPKVKLTIPAGESDAQDSSGSLDGYHDLPVDSSLRKTVITGTISAKLSYLLSRILELYHDEKILVFYDGENVGFYIAQALELLHVNHLIYAKSLTPSQKSEWIVKFDQDSAFRVLLMDVGQAAFGLNLSSASRVFFVNPVCKPHVEAQAIKRAHRIGQTKKVVVETLILTGTVEEQLFERAKRMTRDEHRVAKALDDDGGIREIIQNAKLLPISDQERKGNGQVAFLQEAQQLWSRPGWATWKNDGNPSVIEDRGCKRKREETSTSESENRPNKKVKSKASFVDVTAEMGPGAIVEAEDGPSGNSVRDKSHSSASGITKAKAQVGSLNGANVPIARCSIFGGSFES